MFYQQADQNKTLVEADLTAHSRSQVTNMIPAIQGVKINMMHNDFLWKYYLSSAFENKACDRKIPPRTSAICDLLRTL